MIEGFLCVDKPPGLTSHDVVNRVRRVARSRKVGHGGTLDPLATGLLIVAIGRATRLLEYIVGQPKEYDALVRLGQESATYDAEGEIVQSGDADVDLATVHLALEQFRGDIWQKPPMFSAIKRDGKPLYELARRGVEVARDARPVTIYELELLAYDVPDLRLRIRCSSGTYIRSLAHDLGQVLGSGAYLAGLRRTAIGVMRVEKAIPLSELTPEALPALLQEMDRAVAHLPALVVTHEEAIALSHGKRLAMSDAAPQESPLRVYDQEGAFVGIAELEGDSWRPHKIFYQSSRLPR